MTRKRLDKSWKKKDDQRTSRKKVQGVAKKETFLKTHIKALNKTIVQGVPEKYGFRKIRGKFKLVKTAIVIVNMIR